MARKIILDVEPGIMDILTLYYALFDPEFNVLGITVCGGTNSLPAALRCVQRILDAIQPEKMPRLGVGMGYLPMPMGDLEEFHSSAFFSAMELPNADYFSVQPACRIIKDLIRENPHEITLLTLGPLTNPARVFSSHPDLAGLLHRMIITGGSVLEPGNATLAAEYNFYRDPRAAEWIMRTPTARTLLPLDVTNQILLDYDILRLLPRTNSTSARFLNQAVCRLLQLHREILGIEGIYVSGMLALEALLHPNLFSGKMMYGEVETEGEKTRGMTIFDRRLHPKFNPDLEVMLSVDATEVKKSIYRFLERLTGLST